MPGLSAPHDGGAELHRAKVEALALAHACGALTDVQFSRAGMKLERLRSLEEALEVGALTQDQFERARASIGRSPSPEVDGKRGPGGKGSLAPTVLKFDGRGAAEAVDGARELQYPCDPTEYKVVSGDTAALATQPGGPPLIERGRRRALGRRCTKQRCALASPRPRLSAAS